ncbi:hypothetical protein M0812_16567 [Anaeramoeba flamelloides]|uniref:Uncharacterized protein n=1 Tax=Anaeramoeba flamelloides TaxID=1746091 RepID=A0AAV7Z8A7_9EUKA|nr:hypothetical protein M0812_16567 [Anaeramoeba flamelloides]
MNKNKNKNKNKKKNNNHTTDKNYLEFFSRKFSIEPQIKLPRRAKRKPITTRRTREMICKHKNLKKPKRLITNRGFRTKKIQKKCQQCSTTRHVKRYQLILLLEILSNNNSIKHTIHQDLHETLLCDYCVDTKQLGFMRKKIKANCKVINAQLFIFQSTRYKNWVKLIEESKKCVQRKEKKWESFVQLEKEKRNFDRFSKEENEKYMTSDNEEDSYESSDEDSDDDDSDEKDEEVEEGEEEDEEVEEVEEGEDEEVKVKVGEEEVKVKVEEDSDDEDSDESDEEVEEVEEGEEEMEEKEREREDDEEEDGEEKEEKKIKQEEGVEIIDIDHIEEKKLKNRVYIDLELEYEKTEQKSDDEIEIISISEKKILDNQDTKNNNRSKLMKNN